jgi:hypothetical protein
MDGNGTQPVAPQDIPPLIIKVRADGKGVEVTGPIVNKELCWRMLTDAASAILNYKVPAAGLVIPTIVPPKDIGRPQ